MRYAGDIAIQKREIDKIKIKIVPFIINLVETVPLDIHRFKSKKKGALVSEEFALFFWNSLGYMHNACAVAITVESTFIVIMICWETNS